MNRSSLQLTAGIVIATGSWACTAFGPRDIAKKEKSMTTIVLVVENGACRPTDPVQLRRYRKQQVTWHIINQCHETYIVRIDNFRPKDSNTGLMGPPDAQAIDQIPLDSGPIPAGGETDIKAKVKDVSADTIYKYDILFRADTNPTFAIGRDPDIEIWN